MEGTGVRLRGPERGPRSGGADPTARRSAREPGSAGCVLSASARIRRLTPWMNVESSGTYQSPKGGRCSKSGVAASAASWTVRTGRLAAGATVGSGFGGITCWGWYRRQGQTRVRAEGVSSDNPKGKLPGKARAPLGGSPARLAVGTVEAKGSCRGDKDRELVWLRATRSQHVSVTRITHQAAVLLGFAQSVTEAYQVQLRLSSEPQFVLRAEGIETLECIRSRSEQGGARALQPDVIIGWPDWGKVQLFTIGGWAIPGQAFLGATTPATKWHLRMNRKGGPPMYLNVELDPMRKRSTITHEAAVSIGMPYEPFYMLFARAEDGEVRNLVAVGADAIVRADRRRPEDPKEKGPDLLMDTRDARGMAKCLRPGWKSEQEIGGQGGCPVEGQWHGKLKGRQVLRDPGWTCVLYVKTGGANKDIFMRVMFDTIREQSVVLHSVAVKLGLRRTNVVGHQGEDPRYSSCVYEVPVLDWKGRRDWIKAQNVSYATPSEQCDMPEGAMEAFPEISLSGVMVSQAAGPVDMIIGRDNPEWMPVPVQEEPYERFTLMWTSLSPRCILRDNEEVKWRM
jgi:hypothetical protein